MYWKPSTKVNDTLSYNDSVDKVREDLLRSVSLRLRSDVPIAFCMSGGIDSNALISIASREKALMFMDLQLKILMKDMVKLDLVKKAVLDLRIDHTSIPLQKNF